MKVRQLFLSGVFFCHLAVLSRAENASAPAGIAAINSHTPPFLNLAPGPHFWPRVRMWQGVPGLERAANGRLWATWYAGLLGEGKDQNYAALVTSEDDGKTWSKPVAVYDPSRNYLGADVSDPTLWIDGSGKMWWFINRAMKIPNDVIRTCWGFYTDDPTVAKPTWKGPVFVGYGNILNKPFVLDDGSWLLLLDWFYSDSKSGDPHLKKGIHFYKFNGYEKPFEHYSFAAVKDSIFTEPMVVKRRDGTLWMLARTKYGISQSESKDAGKTWQELDPFTRDFSVNTRFFFTRLQSGNLLLVANDDSKARARLTAMLSKDDGKTWPYKLMLDERNPVSYPDGVETKDGFIYLIYDRGRYLYDMQEILLAKITEADIEAGKLVNPASKLKQTVSKLKDEGGGVHFDGETWKMTEEFEKLNSGGPKRAMEEGEKAEKLKPATNP